VGFITEEENVLGMKYTVHAGANFTSGGGGYRSYNTTTIGVSPNVLYQQQGDFKQLNVGSYFTVDPFVAGIWYRHAFENPDAIIISLGLHYQNLRFGYSYDYGVSALGNATGGAHEISMAWIFECDKKRRNLRAIKCPSF
jgi:type IX secretion system PorP/SprF family membrane protein